MSFRPARDETHITQLLGRMVRTPLARRVPGDDMLNSVACLLPRFDRQTATKVAQTMMGEREADADGTGGGGGRRVLLAPIDMVANSSIPEAVWDALVEVPSQTLPRRVARPVRRLTALAQALSRDGLRKDARKDAYRKLFAKLDGLTTQHREDVAAASKGSRDVPGETLVARFGGGEAFEYLPFVEVADEKSVEADFRAACRRLTADVARKYADHVAGAEDDDGLLDAHVRVAALAQVDGVPDALDREAERIAKRWFADYRVAIKGLSDERQAVYDEIRSMSPKPRAIEVKRPRIRTEETRDADGDEWVTRTGLLMSDGNGAFPVGSFNNWEIEVLDKEMARPGFQAWYRNPSRPSGDALTVAYRNDRGEWRRMCPDFLFFHGVETVKVSIVDPHGPHLADALPKLRGLAEFAEKHGESFYRIESVARIPGGVLRVLDLTEPSIREAVAKAHDAESLYRSDAAADY